ncbi:MAG: CpaD family pilus assembly protein [Parvularcula sp.]
MRRTFLSITVSAILLSACSTVFNSEQAATTVAERHPISIDQQTVSTRIKVDPSLSGLSRDDHAKLDAFLTAYRTRGHGPITVTAPSSGDGIDLEGQQTAANVRAALHTYGLQYEDMRGATYRTRASEREVIVSFTRYVASAPVCGDFGGDRISRLTNRPAPNFGCADQTNLAAMVADPRDLTGAQEPEPTAGNAPAAAIRSANTGLVTFDDSVGLGAGTAGASN